MQRTTILAAQDRGLGVLGGDACARLVERDDGVDGRIGAGNARQAGVEQLDRRDLPRRQQAAQLNSARVARF